MSYYDDGYGCTGWEREEGVLEPNEFLTPREVMDLLCIGRNTFYRLVNSGELPAFRIGKLWRVKREELERYPS